MSNLLRPFNYYITITVTGNRASLCEQNPTKYKICTSDLLNRGYGSHGLLSTNLGTVEYNLDGRCHECSTKLPITAIIGMCDIDLNANFTAQKGPLVKHQLGLPSSE